MTYIITLAGKDSIYMASDSRMNYFKDKVVDGEKYQEVLAIADGIKKTFFIKKLKIGIQFLGIGFFPDGDSKYPISHFIRKLENKKSSSIDESFKLVFNFFKDLSIKGNTGQYVKGVMSAIEGQDKKICLFNTFNNDFRVMKLMQGKFLDSENNQENFSLNEDKILEELEERIIKKSKEKWWTIGGEITLLKLTKDSFNFLLDFEEKFNSFSEIKWDRINPPKLDKYQ